MAEKYVEVTDEGYERLLNLIDEKLQERGVLSGIPLNFLGEERSFVGNSRDPLLSQFFEHNIASKKGEEESDPKVRNCWRLKRSWRGLHGIVYIVTKDNGHVDFEFVLCQPPAAERMNMWLETVGTRRQTSFRKAEQTAREKLKTLVSKGQWECYELEGTFIEDGKQSGLVYLIRKGRPTLALRHLSDGSGLVPICTLCLHPMGYFDGTWAGALAPSDEVISHLLHIRGDEYHFWKKANHIPIDDPRSGI